LNRVRLSATQAGFSWPSISIAFFVTVLASLSYGLLEAFAGAPRLSALWTYTIAMLTWGFATLILARRLSA
jgi:hypothetical protein